MTAWVRHGECNHCGHCCTFVAREVLVRTREEIRRDPAFYTARGFAEVEVDGQPRHVLWAWLHAPCPQFTGGRCGIQAVKPETCVAFPQRPQDIVGTPCSYWFERAGVAVGGTGSPFPSSEASLLAVEAAG
jgi:Fe-S-cluster containining protein